MTLTAYNKKRDFQKSPEPKGQAPSESKGWRFVIQKHHASHLHYDLRLELDGVLKSWAVPKGPSLDPKMKRLAIHVEDHPIEYAEFEGIIPSGYGAGTVIVWDRGHWTPQDETDPGYQRGSMTFTLDGDKLKGEWKLVRTRRAKEDRDHWLFMKVHDKHAKDENTYSITEKKPKSVQSGKTLEQIGGKTPAKKPKSRSTARSKMQSTGIASVALANDIDPSALPGAQLAAWPRKVLPQLATLGSKVPQGDEWEHEIKFDGYRLLAHISAGEVRLMTRSGLDWTGRFQSLVPALQSLPIERAILDGEVVVLDDKGLSSFQMLQNQLKSKTPLKPEAGRTIDIVAFIELAEVDPIYYDRTYYVVPDEGGAKGYKLLLEAMSARQTVALARFVMREREHLAALRPMADGGLALHTMHCADEIVRWKDLANELPQNVNVSKQEDTMAGQLIESLTQSFDPTQFHDDYRERLEELLKKKAEGEEIKLAPSSKEDDVPPVYNLMEALKKSVEQGKRAKPAAGKSRTRQTKSKISSKHKRAS